MSPLPESLATPDGRLSDLALERYVAGELNEDEASAVARHLASHPPDAQRVEATREHESSFRSRGRPAWLDAATSGAVDRGPQARAEETSATPPPAAVAPAPSTARAANNQRAFFGFFAAAVAVMVAFVMVPGADDSGPSGEIEQPSPNGPEHDVFRAKGVGGLELAVFTEDQHRLATGDAVHPGDRLGFQVQSSQAGHLVIIGVDATGEAYACHPQGADHAVSIDASEDLRALDSAIRLDATGDRERLVALRCPESQPTSELQALVAAAARDLPGDQGRPRVREACAQDELILRKTPAEP